MIEETVTKERILNEALKIYLRNDTDTATGKDNLMYCMGNANALNSLCNAFSIDLTNEVKKYKANRNENHYGY